MKVRFIMVAKKMSEVSIGEYFTKKPVEYPKVR